MNMKQDSRICVISGPLPRLQDYRNIANLLHLIKPLGNRVFAITAITDRASENIIYDKSIHIINIGYGSNNKLTLVKIFKFILLQIKMSYALIKIANNVNIVLFSNNAVGLVLPMLSAKLLGKKIVSIWPRLDETDYKKMLFGMGTYIFPWITNVVEMFHCSLSDKIVIVSANFTSPALKRYTNKILYNGSRFFTDISHFKLERNLDSRENLVGYVGRLSKVKGVMNFVRAIPLILRESPTLRFLMAGDGSLKAEIEQAVKDADLGNKVNLEGWIPHEKIPRHLNKLKLLVIPSYNEVGPQLLFEAMACGTPVLATPVGVIPDVIKDGETGFIMENNWPECIATNVIRALNHPNLNQIAKAARELIEREYTYEAAVERYRGILGSLR